MTRTGWTIAIAGVVLAVVGWVGVWPPVAILGAGLVVLAGGACGKLVRGYHYREPGGNLCKVHVTIQRALGIDCPSYGFNGAETTEHLTGILA